MYFLKWFTYSNFHIDSFLFLSLSILNFIFPCFTIKVNIFFNFSCSFFLPYFILQNISHAKHFGKRCRNLRHNSSNYRFGFMLWFFAKKHHQIIKTFSYIFIMIQKVLYLVFSLHNIHLIHLKVQKLLM